MPERSPAVILSGHFPFSGGVTVSGEVDQVILRGLTGDLNPARMTVTRDPYAADRLEGVLTNRFVTMTYDGAVDVSRYH